MEDNLNTVLLISVGFGGLFILWALRIWQTGRAPLYHGQTAHRSNQPFFYWLVLFFIALVGVGNVAFGLWMHFGR